MIRPIRIALVVLLALAASFLIDVATSSVAWVPMHTRAEMLSRQAGGDPHAKNIYYFLAVGELVTWYRKAILPGITGVVLGVFIFVARLGVRERAIAALIAIIVTLALTGVSQVPPWIGSIFLFFCALGVPAFGDSIARRERARAGGEAEASQPA